MIKNKLAIILTARKNNLILEQTINAIYKQNIPKQLIILAEKEKINFLKK